MGRLLSRVPMASISLFDWRPTSPRPDLIFVRTLRAVAVKGGRRPSRSDLPLTVASTASSCLSRARRVCPARSVQFRQRRRYRGELAIGRASRHELVFGRPRRSHHDAVMRIGGEAPRGGPILNRGAQAIVQVGLPPPRSVVCSWSVAVTLGLQQLRCGYGAGRSRRPSGASPVVASRHRTMRSLRASATIIVLRTPRRASAVRLRYHALSGLPFWCTR